MNDKEFPIEVGYQVKRENGGYCLYRLTIQNKKVIAKAKASEPDVLVITMTHLERMIRKEQEI